MKSFIAVCLCLVAAINAAPAGKSGDDALATIVREEYEANPDDGTYKFSFETSNGIKAEESGKQIQVGEEKGAAADGAFSYTAPDGTVISLTYSANDNGFQPQGAHLPTPPPMPDHVVKLLADLAKLRKA